MKKFDKILICTDLDGTLLKNDKTVSPENNEAIDYFKSEGGSFTFITGRMPFYSEESVKAAQPNVPFGCINGGGIFDHEKGDYLWKTEISRACLELVEAVDRELPYVGIQLNTFYKAYFCKDNAVMEWFRSVTNLPNIYSHYNDVKEPIAKVIFGFETDEEYEELYAFLMSQPLAESFDFIRSEKHLCEILPKGVNKGICLLKLAELLDIDKKKTVAIGDYNNDVSMIKAAGVGVAVANACREAIDAADVVTVSNEEHAICRIINDIDLGKYLD